MKTKSVVLLGCGLVLLCVLLLGLAGGGFFYYMVQDPPDLLAWVESPDQVAVGDEFALKVFVVNERKTDSLKITSIDLGESYLDHFTVRETQPRAISSQHVPIDDSQSFGFNAVIAPGNTNVFTFQLRAANTGVHRGDVDVCEGIRFVTLMAQTKVR